MLHKKDIKIMLKQSNFGNIFKFNLSNFHGIYTPFIAFNRKKWIHMCTKNQPDMRLKIVLKYFGV